MQVYVPLVECSSGSFFYTHLSAGEYRSNMIKTEQMGYVYCWFFLIRIAESDSVLSAKSFLSFLNFLYMNGVWIYLFIYFFPQAKYSSLLRNWIVDEVPGNIHIGLFPVPMGQQPSYPGFCLHSCMHLSKHCTSKVQYQILKE